MDAWANFGVAVTGATAALIGLLVVALSINLRQIVGSEHLPTRALLALLLLVMPLVAGILLLVPQTTTAFGVELVVLGVVVGIWLGVLARPAGCSVGRALGAVRRDVRVVVGGIRWGVFEELHELLDREEPRAVVGPVLDASAAVVVPRSPRVRAAGTDRVPVPAVLGLELDEVRPAQQEFGVPVAVPGL